MPRVRFSEWIGVFVFVGLLVSARAVAAVPEIYTHHSNAHQ